MSTFDRVRVLGQRGPGLALLVLVGCETGQFRPDDDETEESTTEVSEPPAGLDCENPIATPDPGLEGDGACVTEVIACGDVIRGTNLGGSTVFGAAPGENFSQCAGSSSQTENLAGPERVYQLPLDGTVRDLHVELASCEKSLLFWYQEEACSSNLLNCNYAPDGTWYEQSADVALVGTDSIYLVVEGVGNDGGNFELTVDCFTY